MARQYFTPNRSAFIRRLGYNPTTRVLRVYMDGRYYDYADVSRFTWYRLRQSKSVGRYYSLNIKGKYARRVA